MPDLGKYAATVLLAYGVSLTLLITLIAGSLWQARRTKKKLDAEEARRG